MSIPEVTREQALMALGELVYGGEFAAWVETGVEMPLAALREWEEARELWLRAHPGVKP